MTSPGAEERYEALAGAAAASLEALADQILAGLAEDEVVIVAGPEVALGAVRLPVPGTSAGTAVVGHVALTSATVTVAGVRGDGTRPGRDLAGALAAAVCDAEAERAGPLAGAVADLCAAAAGGRADGHRRWAGIVEATRVGRS